MPIIGAANINLIVSSLGKYQRSNRIENDAHSTKINNMLSVNIIISFLENLGRFDNLLIIYFI
tara:strand:- start:344 stop:532 length:189 start_codon:yes stop_codon:yes gene_type:complete